MRDRSSQALCAFTVLAVFVLAIGQVTSYDTWVHLSLGRWMAENDALPRTNLLSHTMPDRPTVTHQWLFQSALYHGWTLLGPGAMILVKAAIVAGAFALALATAVRKGAIPAVACVMLVVAASAARFRFTLRPQVAAFLLLAAYLYICERWRHGGVRALVLLLPLQVVWANLHGSAVLGITVALGFAGAESVRRLLAPDAPGRRALAALWAAALLLAPLTLLNPNGATALTLPFSHAGAQAASGLKEILRDRASMKWAELTGEHLFFGILAAAALLTLFVSVRRRDVTETGLVLGFLAMAMRSERFVGLFAVAAAPIIARNVSVCAASLFPRHGGRPAVWALAALSLAALGLRHSSGLIPFGLTVQTQRLPVEALALVQERYPLGKLYNEFEHGGYIAWAARRPVFIDSRGVLAYDPEHVARVVSLWTTEAPSLDGLDASVALVGRERVRRLFEADPRWRGVARTPVCWVYVTVPPPQD